APKIGKMNFGTWLNKSCAMRTNLRQRAPLTRCNAIDLQRSEHLPDDRENQNRKHAHMPSCGQSGSFLNLVLEGHAFGTVFLKPFFRGVRGGERRQPACSCRRRQKMSLVSLELPSYTRSEVT